MNKKSGMVFGVALCALALGFANDNSILNGGSNNGFDFPNTSYKYHITFDDLVDAVKKGEEKQAQADSVEIDKEIQHNLQSDAQKNPTGNAANIEQIKSFAEKGNPHFQFLLGRCYARGEGVPQDYAQAEHWYALSAEQDNHKAQNNLGCLYLDGTGVEKNTERALYWFERAAKMDDSYAYLNIGEMYRDGNGVPQDFKKAMDCFKKAEKLGAKEALDAIGHQYERGFGVKKNDKKAFQYFKKAAEQG